MNIFGKYIDDNEKVLKSLTKIYGIGRPTAQELCMSFGIGLDRKVKDLSKDTWSTLIKAAEFGPNKYKDLVKELQDQVSTEQKKNTKLIDAINLFVSAPSVNQSLSPQSSPLLGAEGFVTINGKLRSQKVEVRALTDLRERLEAEKKMKTYRGLRHLEGLPVRGQRTSTNALTARKRRSKA